MQEFFQLYGGADLEPLGSSEARPLSRLADPQSVECGLLNPWSIGAEVQEDESITGPPAPVNPSKLTGITCNEVGEISMDKQFMESGHSKMQRPELPDYEISVWRAAPGWNWNSLPPYQQKRSPLLYVATTGLLHKCKYQCTNMNTNACIHIDTNLIEIQILKTNDQY